jgi:hypothetical protein
VAVDLQRADEQLVMLCRQGRERKRLTDSYKVTASPTLSSPARIAARAAFEMLARVNLVAGLGPCSSST